MNYVGLIGRLGADPEVRYTTSGKPVANLRLATSKRWKDDNGDTQTRTQWHRVVYFGRMAEVLKQHCKKGRQIRVVGELQTRKWQDKDGNDRYTTEVIGTELDLTVGYNPEPKADAEDQSEVEAAAVAAGADGPVPVDEEDLVNF